MTKYSLWDRSAVDGPIYGISCDGDGIFIAGKIPLVERSSDADGSPVYAVRSEREVSPLFKIAYGRGVDFSSQIAGLNRVARYMTEGKWALAKIAAVQLRFPELPDERAVKTLMAAEAHLSKCQCNMPRAEGRTSSRKRDVSDEPRVPAGQSGGGEWTTGDSPERSTSNPLLIPAQVEVIPTPGTIPFPFDLPAPPTEVTPFPFDVPGANLEPSNPYADRPECAEEWAHATEFCQDLQRRGKLRGGYGGFGKNFASCVMGMVSEACGGNPTGA